MINNDRFADTRESEDLDQGRDEASSVDLERGEWLQRARSAFSASTDYMDTNIIQQWETNLYNFRSKHPEGNKKRKMFRPKTRTAIRQHEAALVKAMFSNSDLLYLEPPNKNDPIQAAGARLNQSLLQYRLDHSIDWFTTVAGAYQDTHKQGICISKQYWEYETKEIKSTQPLLDDNGEQVHDDEGYALGTETVTGNEVTKDHPAINLIAPENFRFDPNADWRNPIKDSPYIIELMPMYIGKVLEMMEEDKDGKTGQKPWHKYTIDQVVTHGLKEDQNSSTRQARNGRGTDQQNIAVDNEFKTVWVHFNVYREKGVDMAFYTVGTGLMLTDPVPLTDMFIHGRSLYQVGFSVMETHNTYPAGLAELTENLQKETNLLADQRYDNVRLVLNKRYFVRRNGNVDLAALMNNVPGGGIVVDNPNEDVRVIDTNDVTSSSYAEQDRLNMDMDDLTGVMSGSTVQANRSLNETVGGMNLMKGGATDIQEYMIKTFIETWVDPVLRALVMLEQAYETDETILMIAANKSQAQEEIQMNHENLDKMINTENMSISVNVGMGNTDPQQKVQRLMMAVNASANLPGIAAETDFAEVTKEIFSFAGYGDGGRFLKKQQKQPQQQQTPPEIQLKMEQLKQDGQIQTAKLQMENDQFNKQLSQDREIALARLAQDKGLTIEKLKTQLGIENNRNQTNRDVKAMQASLANREMNIKTTQGSGI